MSGKSASLVSFAIILQSTKLFCVLFIVAGIFAEGAAAFVCFAGAAYFLYGAAEYSRMFKKAMKAAIEDEPSEGKAVT